MAAAKPVLPQNEAASEKPKAEPLKCGLVMPLALTDGCTPQHWNDVRNILTEAIEGIEAPKFVASMVSNADEVAVIQTSIVKNLYANEVIVCDVSGRNANVMFELGMRLAFDKPTVIVKDDKTDYSFDTSPVEHIPYPRDLRYAAVQEFKAKLSEKVLATYEHHKKNGNGAGYLASFGPIKVAKMDTQEVGPIDIVLSKLSELQSQINRLSKSDDSRAQRDQIGLGRDWMKVAHYPEGAGTSAYRAAFDTALKGLDMVKSDGARPTKARVADIAQQAAESHGLTNAEGHLLLKSLIDFMT